MFSGGTVNSTWGANNNNQQQQPGGSVFGGGQPSAFGQSAFGTPATGGGGAFGQNNNQQSSVFGTPAATNTGSAFGAFSTPANNTATSAFGAAKPSTGFGAFSGGQTSAFGGGGSTPSAFGGGAAQPSAFGNANAGTSAFGGGTTGVFGQAKPNAFGISPAGQGPVTTGSLNPPYASTPEKDGTSATIHYQSISAMDAYKSISFEELRAQDYEQGRKTASAPAATGTFGGSTFGAAQPSAFGQPQQAQTSAFGAPAAAPSAFGSFGGGANTNTGSAFGSGGTSAFGQPQQQQAQQPSAFGTFGAAQQPQPAQTNSIFGGGTSAFGAKPATGGFGAFGGTNNAGTGTSAFGATNTGTSLFGGTQQQQPAGSSLFGANNNTANSGTSLFGANANKGIFGQAAPAAGGTSAFGGGGTGQFGSTQNQQQQPAAPAGGTGLFGGGSAFGAQNNNQQQPAQGGSIFGGGTTTNPPAANTGSSLFGGGGGNSLFGNNNNNQQQPQQNSGTSLFGAKPAGTGTSLFGGTGGNSLFGGNQNNQQTSAPQGSGGLFSSTLGANTNNNQQQQQQGGFGSGSLFGGNKSTFGAPAQPQQNSGGMFGGSTLNSSMANPGSQGTLTASISHPVTTNFPIFNLLQSQTNPIDNSKKNNFFVDIQTRKPMGRSLMNTSISGSKLRGFGSSTNLGSSVNKFSYANGNPHGLSVSKPPDSKPADILLGRSGSPALGTGTKKNVKKLVFDKKVEPQQIFVRSGSPSPMRGKVLFTPALSIAQREKEAKEAEERAKAAAGVLSTPTPAPRQVTSPNRFSAEDASQHGEYYTVPPIEVLKTEFSHDQLSHVENLKIGRVGYGELTFLAAVNLSELNNLKEMLGELVVFEEKECIVYPDIDEESKPGPGHGLNVPARIRLVDCFPTDKATKKVVKDPTSPAMRKFAEKLKAIRDTTFESYEPKTGEWVFTVKGF
ncbi:hypothetical protein CYLTODRAFT_364979 [Cylindrobasidium torrendii FP15055 ss-10]|uniref:Peptidase S59 domain-containing protein n=1 Tax=Cylindrobasidium torrendii FP15055 ss-10 TaxID=1314674 RepID=A0A0D7BUV1_9AGAR|nr:hypothetical protein CYLTODRAFT_364979 [Cylindrobasidium torrendii FP15055 ss-10]